jgi:hypothetical protein
LMYVLCIVYCYMYIIHALCMFATCILWVLLYVCYTYVIYNYICSLCMLQVYYMYVKSYLHWIWTIHRYYKARSHELWNMIESASACVIEWGKKEDLDSWINHGISEE